MNIAKPGRLPIVRFLFLGSVSWMIGLALAAGKVGEMAADWSGLKGLDNKTYNLKDFRGKVVLLMTVQYDCGGCKANAPNIGKVAKSFQGKPFQALGPDINFGTSAQLGTFDKLLRGSDTSLNFPLLSGLAKNTDIKDSLDKNGNRIGTLWIPYNALRDVYFVIDHTGKIVFRMEGNRSSVLDSSKYTGLKNAITNAIADIPPVSILSVGKGQGLCLQACKKNGVYLFDLSYAGTLSDQSMSLKIMDLQGRIVRTLRTNPDSRNPGTQRMLWDGKDDQGNPAAWGNYFVNAKAAGRSSTVMLSLIP